MNPRNCARLLLIGVCTGVLPACLGGPGKAAKPMAGLPAEVPVAPLQDPKPKWSPYGVIAYGDRSKPTRPGSPANLAKAVTLEKTPLPERPTGLAKTQPTDRIWPPAVSDDDPPTRLVIPHAAAEDPPLMRTSADVPAIPQALPPSVTAEPRLVSALRCYMEKRPDEAVRHLDQYDRENQDILLSLLPLTARMADGPIAKTDPREVADVLDQLNGVMLALRPRAALVMDKVGFCRQVHKFGVYEPLTEKPTFRHGQWAEVYCEIRNVACEPYKSPQGEYRTHLQNAMEIRDPTRGFVIRHRSEKADLCRTPQHDYYQHYSFAIKGDMRPGPYSLTVEVVDVPTGRKVSRKLEFNVRAD